MCEDKYKNLFQTIEMKHDMKERVMNRCCQMNRKRTIRKGARILIAASCCFILFIGTNTITTHAYGVNLLSKFYHMIQTDDNKAVEIDMTERRDRFSNITITPALDTVDKDLYEFLSENNMINIVIPQKYSNDWTLTESHYSKAGMSSNLKPSITFNMSNGIDQIYASIDGGIADTTAYHVGIDYVETKVVNEIEFLIVHQKIDLTYEDFLKDLENALIHIMGISAEELYKTNTYADLNTEETYLRFAKFCTFVNFSAGGYDYSYGLTNGIDIDYFINSLISD